MSSSHAGALNRRRPFTLRNADFSDRLGRITSTEAVLKQLPLIHTAPIPGLESYNAHFFHYHDMSYRTRDPNIQAEIAIRLCQDAKYRSRMTDAQLRNSYPDCCEDIISKGVAIVTRSAASGSRHD